ncbi:uncharacterized protein C3orf30-like [Stylophora pistillata]|uniref:Uncharacterized protein n=1 Tax=Stylophora pistillata TaxID=50429 RepID=A0A2B4RKU5_STYPI|nr:uncharacterized protein C3orf30-like [Stylophora pistillata]PFX19034.1 hypothetical protein AWC38_SpisGene16574 [Stylophora pistillata]
MNEDEPSVFETSADNVNQTEISVSDSFTSNQINGASAHSPSRETETNEPSSTESAPGFPRGNIEASDDNDTTETPQFESRAAAMSSLNADATANSSCVTDDGKIEEKNSRPDLKESHEGELNGVQVTEESPFLQSVKYLEKHQILRLFQNFAAQIVYKRPDNPLQYLVDELEGSREEVRAHEQVPVTSKDSDTPDMTS